MPIELVVAAAHHVCWLLSDKRRVASFHNQVTKEIDPTGLVFLALNPCLDTPPNALPYLLLIHAVCTPVCQHDFAIQSVSPALPYGYE